MQSIKHLVSLLDSPAVLVRSDGSVLAANDAFLRFLEIDESVLVRTGLAHYTRRAATELPISKSFDSAQKLEIQSSKARMMMSAKRVETPDETVAFLCQKQFETNLVDPMLGFFLDHLDQGVWEYDTCEGRFFFSEKWCKIRGVETDREPEANSDEWLLDIHPNDRPALKEMFEGQTRGDNEAINIQYRYRHANGKWIWIWCRGQVMERGADGRPVWIVGSDTDITDIKESEAGFVDLANKLQLAVEVSGIGTFEFDSETQKVFWDDRMLSMYGIEGEPNLRDSILWDQYLHPEDRDLTIKFASECQAVGRDFLHDYRIIRPDGEVRFLRSIARYVQSQRGTVRMVGVNIDMTEDFDHAMQLEAARNQLKYDSHHDALTGLANRRMLDEVVEGFLGEISPDDVFAILHLDLDFFKQVNDTLGHAAGDALLVYVAQELRALIEETDVICRVGGDEFAVFFRAAPSHSALARLAENIISIGQKPFEFEDQLCSFGVSVGIAVAQGAPQNRSEVFVNADMALYAAKQSGRGQYQFFNQKIRASNAKRLTARQDLAGALANDELICFFQPQFDAQSLQLVGAEALVRWNCPRRGIVEPAEFLPLADEVGLTSQIDAVVFERVCQAQDGWVATGLPFPTISVNLSKQRLSERSLRTQLADRLDSHHTISFELLESAFLDTVEGESLHNLEFIRKCGLEIELDDFGSGRSSIVAMQNVRPHRIKIDRSLTYPIVNRPSQLLILQALSRVARLDGVGVVVEGIETDSHLATIRNVDCDVIQGFALGYPMSKEDFEALLLNKGTGISDIL